MPPPFDFTPESQRVLLRAGREAAELGHAIIGTEHVLLALTSVRDAGLATTWRNLGVDPAAVRATTLTMLGIPPEQQARDFALAVDEVPELPFTHRMKDAIEWAIREAQEIGEGRVTSSTLLLGLLREGEGVAAKALQQFEVTVEAVRSASMGQ